MDATTRKQYAHVSAFQWDHMGYTGLAARPNISPLTNDIHPLFQRRNEKRAEGNKNVWYLEGRMDGGRPRPIIEPLLRLATHMMKCPANDRYLFNLIESPREDIPELSQRFTAQASFFRQMPDIPNWLVKEKVDRALDRLSMKLRFIVRDPGQYPDLAGSRGMTTPDMDHFARISIADDVRLSGVLPVICLNERMFTVFEELKNRPGNNTNQILNAEFNLAKTFLHELAHAIHFATDPDAYRVAYCMSKNHLPILPFKNMEPLFEEEGKLELGYSYENFVFGGLGRWDLGPDEPSFVNDWPCTNGPGVYMRGPEEATKVYVMPMTFIHSVHQQPFWDRMDPNNLQALHIPRVI